MNLQSHWQLDPSLTYFNHGAFGATPTIVLEAQRRWRDGLERDPIAFLGPERDLIPKLDVVRGRIGELVHASPDDVVFVRSATDGVNAVLRSFPLAAGDEIIITDHGYNACNNAARYVAGLHGAVVTTAEVPFPLTRPGEVVEAIASKFSSKTKLLLVDHVTSPTGLVFPIQEIVAVAHERGIRVLVDGAHAPGMVPVDLKAIQADYYTGNHHKWLCAPKTSAFLWVRDEWQHEVRPNIISHGANQTDAGRSRFQCEFDWQGTFDPSPILAIPAAIDFLSALFPGGLSGLMRSNHDLALSARAMMADALKVPPPAPESMIGTLVALPLPPNPDKARSNHGDADPLQAKLRNQYAIEIPIFSAPKPTMRLLRLSLQAYNDLDQVNYLIDALRKSFA